jgi:hypothetical protein
LRQLEAGERALDSRLEHLFFRGEAFREIPRSRP